MARMKTSMPIHADILASFRDVLRGGALSLLVRLAIMMLCAACYGAVLGSSGGITEQGVKQSMYSAIKVPMLLTVSFAIGLPSFFVFNTLFGLRADFVDVVRTLVGGQAVLTVVLASLAPYTLLWYASFESYVGAQLFSGAMFALATFAAQAVLRRRYRPLIARNSRHRWLLVLWVVLYCFVAIQMAWVLRPFIGAPGLEVQFFRADSWGNAYVILGRGLWNGLTK